MNKVCFFSIADDNNLKYFKAMENSLKKFHPDIPLILYDQKQIISFNDNDFFYRATPILAKRLIKDFETVIKIDADSIVTGDLSSLWTEMDYDVACVNNSNPRELKKLEILVWNINPLAYVNCGFVAMRNKEFIEHWLGLCYSEHFYYYRYREQDLLNILAFYGNYKVKLLDQGDSYYGLASKGYWNMIELRDGKLVLPKREEWPDQDKEIKVIHVAGGNDPMKMNLRPYFKEEVIKHLEKLIDGKL